MSENNQIKKVQNVGKQFLPIYSCSFLNFKLRYSCFPLRSKWGGWEGWLDEENNMYYYSARYYAPPTFISRDPMFEKYPSFSPYTYCANNPMKFVDPTGKTLEDGGGDPPPGYKPQKQNFAPFVSPEAKKTATANNSTASTKTTVKNTAAPSKTTASKNNTSNTTTSQTPKNNNPQQNANQNSSANLPDANTSDLISLSLTAIAKSNIPKQLAEKVNVANIVFSGIQITESIQDISKNGLTANNAYNLVKTSVGMCGLPGVMGAIMIEAYKNGGTYFLNAVQQLNQQLPEINNPSNWIP